MKWAIHFNGYRLHFAWKIFKTDNTIFILKFNDLYKRQGPALLEKKIGEKIDDILRRFILPWCQYSLIFQYMF